MLDNFFQSDRRPIKVYVFEKPLTRVFQKYVLLWVFDNSEKSYGRKPILDIFFLGSEDMTKVSELARAHVTVFRGQREMCFLDNVM